MSEAAATDAKKSEKDSRFGWLMLGMCIDYFIFKPVRYTRALWLIALGFAMGSAYTYGLDNIAALASRLLG